MAESLLFLTELTGLPVFDLKGRRMGRVKDAAVTPRIHPARVDRFLVGGGWAWLTVRSEQVGSISLDGIHLSDEQLTPYHDDEYMLRMCRDLLDQQIIDVNGRKLVRVNDVTFDIRKEDGRDTLWVLEVDVGIRSIFRRLCQGVIPPRWIRRAQQPIQPSSIRWEFCNIVEPDPQRRLRLNITNQMLETMHPADLADIVEELTPAERESIFETLASEVAADALSEIEPKTQASILESLEPEVAADILEEMAPDEAAAALSELEEETSEEILDEMESDEVSEVRELLEFEEDTAGGMMTTEYVALPEQATVADARAALDAAASQYEGGLLETLNTLFLIDAAGVLKAAVPLGRLFGQPGASPLAGLASERLIQAGVDEKQDRVTERFDKYNLLTLAVVDADGKLAGVITADDIISVLRHR